MLSKIDRVVARLDLENRKISLDILSGNPSTTLAVAPELTRNSNIYEICLAEIRYNSNTTTITQANITDTRLNSELCGVVKGVIEQVDTTTLFNQYQAWFEETKEVSEQEFAEWFEQMKGQLSEDAAGKLQLEIDNLEARKIKYDNTSSGLQSTDIQTAIDELKENGDREVYSTKEIIIGKWIDNKPIYRKTVACGALTSMSDYSNPKAVASGLINVDKVINLYGFAQKSDGSHMIVLPFVPQENTGFETLGTIRVSYNLVKNNIEFMCISSEVFAPYTESYITLEYTKTTD